MNPDDEDAVAATIAPPDLASDVTIAAGGLSPATRPLVRPGPTSSPRRPSTAPAPVPGADEPELPTVEPENYDTADEIARGGMGRIIAATDRRLGRPVALKELLAPGPDSAMRFRREALITARLQHPAIVPVYEAGQWPSGEPFFAMKLVSGKPLDAVIADCHTFEDRLALLPSVTAVCDAIAYAHAQRIVHRDLKPSNVLVGDFGETVVIDWGLAKDLDVPEPTRIAAENAEHAEPGSDLATFVPAERTSTGTRGSTLTIAGAVMGTPAYMPPEQARGDAVDERADVFSLGAMLYHVLAGTPPYGAKIASEVIAAAITGKVVPLRQRAPRAPADLVAIVDRAMSHEPEGRYRTARELAEELRRYQTGQLVGAHTYTAWERVGRFVRRHRAAVTIAAIAVVGFVVGGALAIRSIVAERDAAEDARRVAEGRRTAAEKLVDFMVSDMRERLEAVGKLDLMAGLGEHVRLYYDEMASLPGGMRPEDVDRMAGALSILGEAEKQSGDLDDALRTLEDARTRLRALVEADPDAPETAERRRVVADATQMIGAIQQARGTTDAALISYREAVELYTQARGGATTEREVLLGEADAHDHLGDLLRNRGEPEEAVVEYEAARRLRQDVVDRTGTVDGDLRASYDLSTSEMKLGSAEQNRGASAAALEHYRASVSRRDRLATANPDNVAYQHGLSYVRGVLADLLRETGAVDEARTAYLGSLATLDALVRRDPSNTEWRRDRGTNLANLGFALYDLGDARGALARYAESMANHAELTARDPSNASWQMDVSRTQTRAGDAHLFLGELDAALASHRQALDVRQALVDRDGKSTPWRRALAWSHHKIGAVLDASGDAEGALEAAHRALALRTTLVDAAPKVAGLRNELALSEIMVGRLLRRAGDVAGATPHLVHALDLARALVDTDADNLEWKEALCAALTGQAELGDAAAATEAVALADTIAKAHPENAGWQVALAEAHWAAGTAKDQQAARAILEALEADHRLGFDKRPLLRAAQAVR